MLCTFLRSHVKVSLQIDTAIIRIVVRVLLSLIINHSRSWGEDGNCHCEDVAVVFSLELDLARSKADCISLQTRQEYVSEMIWDGCGDKAWSRVLGRDQAATVADLGQSGLSSDNRETQVLIMISFRFCTEASVSAGVEDAYEYGRNPN
jgi:hypothetical protein